VCVGVVLVGVWIAVGVAGTGVAQLLSSAAKSSNSAARALGAMLPRGGQGPLAARMIWMGRMASLFMLE
jgi:hypothetical protein